MTKCKTAEECILGCRDEDSHSDSLAMTAFLASDSPDARRYLYDLVADLGVKAN